MAQVLQVVINGILLGGIYALLGVGMTMMFGMKAVYTKSLPVVFCLLLSKSKHRIQVITYWIKFSSGLCRQRICVSQSFIGAISEQMC